MKFILPLMLLLAVVIGCGGRIQTANQPAEPTPSSVSTSPAGTLSQPEKKYLGAALGYLSTLDKQNTRLATVMAGASTGESTLGEIKKTIERAQTVENAGYFGDYKSANPPPGYGSVDKDLNEIHDMYVAVFDEYLEYWKDQNLAHIPSGTAKFKVAVKRADGTIKKLNAILAKKKK
jgi:hypothetical protein